MPDFDYQAQLSLGLVRVEDLTPEGGVAYAQVLALYAIAEQLAAVAEALARPR